MGIVQESVKVRYKERGYTDDLAVLGLGLSEEAGEVYAAILKMNDDFKQKDGRTVKNLEHELKDCLVYICAIANSVGIELGI